MILDAKILEEPLHFKKQIGLPGSLLSDIVVIHGMCEPHNKFQLSGIRCAVHTIESDILFPVLRLAGYVPVDSEYD